MKFENENRPGKMYEEVSVYFDKKTVLSVDGVAEAAYLTLSEGVIHHTDELSPTLLIDRGLRGGARGIEFLNLSGGVTLDQGLPLKDSLRRRLERVFSSLRIVVVNPVSIPKLS